MTLTIWLYAIWLYAIGLYAIGRRQTDVIDDVRAAILGPGIAARWRRRPRAVTAPCAGCAGCTPASSTTR